LNVLDAGPLLAASPGVFLEGFRFPLLVAIVAAVVSWGLTPLVRRVAIAKGAVDDPKQDDRRVHTKPTPRWGGMAIYGGILVSLLIVLPFAYPRTDPFPNYLIAVMACGLLLVLIGAYDDVRPMKARWQFLYLLAIGVAVQYFFDPIGRVQVPGMDYPPFDSDLTWIDFGWLAVPITAIYIFVVTKTMDTIDGIDGLAAGVASIAGVTLSIIATYEGQPRVALVAAAIAGASVGFLRHNYNPAKIFMGTGGAQLLGFLLAAFSIVGAFKTAAALALFIPILVFGVPIFDAIFVVIRRIVSRQPVTQADKRHLHHTLLKKGYSQRQTVWILYTVAAALSLVLLVLVRAYG
jgi:UDP-GlcNAc:undecaprenyl-phosphate GlcNAc-1-phosphate transferase